MAHKGTSVNCGHYVSFVRHPNATDGWVMFNDEKVVGLKGEVYGDGVFEGIGQAYLLIWKNTSTDQ